MRQVFTLAHEGWQNIVYTLNDQKWPKETLALKQTVPVAEGFSGVRLNFYISKKISQS